MATRTTRLAAAAATTAALTAGLVTASPGPAFAAAYNGVCGAGYRVIDSRPAIGQGETMYGTIYLTYNAATGNNCVVTIREHPGARMHMSAGVKAEATGISKLDSDDYTTYAGPVYVYAPHGCITWSGEIQDGGWYEGHVHCG